MEDDKKQLALDDYDQIINRLGFGKYQKILFLVVSCGLYVDGIETVQMSLLSYIFMDLWELSPETVSLHPSSLFLGKSLGICFSGLYGDDLGRHTMIKFGMIFISVSFILGPLMPEFYSFVSTRLLAGIGIGLLMPVFGGYIMENFPTDKKSVSIVASMTILPIGQLMIIGLFYIFSPDLDNHNWRIIYPIMSPYVFLSSYLAYVYLKESPMFLLKQGHILQASDTLNYIAAQNNQEPLDTQELDNSHSAMIAPTD